MTDREPVMHATRYQQTVKPDEQAMTTALVGRRLAYPFAVLANRLGCSANSVTVAAGLCWMSALPLVVLAGALCGDGRPVRGFALWFLSGFLWNAGYVLDMADGSLARMTGTVSRRGFYLDHVFHLLFKPAFLASLGLGLFLVQGGGFGWLLLAILAIPANWGASASSVEHVLCEETGKGRLSIGSPPTEGERRLWLGVTDMQVPGVEKAALPVRFVKTAAAEIFSYYGQFSFFSLTVLIDIVLAANGITRMPVTSFCFLGVTAVLTVRVPFRVIRDYRRIAASEKGCQNVH